MNEVSTYSSDIPSKAEDLAKFVLIGRDRLTAVRAAIRAIDKVGVAADVYQQKLAEGQEVAEAVLDAEVRLGELRKNVERKEYHGGRMGSQQCEAIKTPLQQFDEQAKLKKNDASRLETMASHPDVVERVKAEAKEKGELVTRAAVLDAIKKEKDKPHISYNTGNHEWYTPEEYIEAAREVMGSIDLDPASSDIANKVIKAKTYYTEETDGLIQPWFGNIWLNPPYSAELVAKFTNALVRNRPDYNQAIVLVDNATETKWFSALVGLSSAIVFPSTRVKFYMPDGRIGAPLQGQVVLYIGDSPDKFLEVFGKFGWGAKPWKNR